ncbi:MAG TPA: PAS domain-containing protein, partial [Flavisolibacter sp.]|nr:PAS domain-containing protein [Flavisolibacter sp.]
MIPATSILNETAYLHSLLDSMDEPLFATDPTFIVRYWNKSAAQLFGFPSHSTTGKETPGAFPFGFSAEKNAAIQKILKQQGTWKMQVPYHSSKEKLLLLDVTINVLQSG